MPALGVAPIHRLPPSESPLPAVVRVIDERLSRHLSASAVARVRDAVLHGRVVHLAGGNRRGLVVAFKRGVLFVAGTEYVISDE